MFCSLLPPAPPSKPELLVLCRRGTTVILVWPFSSLLAGWFFIVTLRCIWIKSEIQLTKKTFKCFDHSVSSLKQQTKLRVGL